MGFAVWTKGSAGRSAKRAAAVSPDRRLTGAVRSKCRRNSITTDRSRVRGLGNDGPVLHRFEYIDGETPFVTERTLLQLATMRFFYTCQVAEASATRRVAGSRLARFSNRIEALLMHMVFDSPSIKVQ